jgi:hypothetical protein
MLLHFNEVVKRRWRLNAVRASFIVVSSSALQPDELDVLLTARQRKDDGQFTLD